MHDAAELIREASLALTGDAEDALAAWWLLFALRVAPSRDELLAATNARGWTEAGVDAATEVLGSLEGWDWSLVDRALEDGVDRDATGAFYTPAPLARRLADALLEHGEGPHKMVDPACGSGGLLDAVLEALIEQGVDSTGAIDALWGYDINPIAASVARWRLQCRAGTLLTATAGDGPHIEHRDTLRDTLPTDFDAVIANPPFGNAIEKKTGRTDDERHAWADRYPEAATGAYDKASLFVAWALRHTTAGAPIAMLVPRALLSAPYASALRTRCEEVRPLATWLPVERGDWFNAASVHVVGLVWSGVERAASLQVNRTAAPPSTLGWAIAGAAEWCVHTSPWRGWASLPGDWRALGGLADVSASAAVGEAYDWRADITEAEQSDGHSFRLVTSGAIDPLQLLWGRTQRYLKQRYERPVVSVRALSERRRRQAGTPKVLVPGLSAALEAAADIEGRHIGAVATLCVLLPGAPVTRVFADPVFAAGQGVLFGGEVEASLAAESGDVSDSSDVRRLRSLALYLNSAAARGWYLAHYGAQALAGGSVQLTAPKLRTVPVPGWVLSLPVEGSGSEEAEAVAEAVLAAAESRSHELPIKRPPPSEWRAPAELVERVAGAGVANVWSALLAREGDVAATLWASSVVLSGALVFVAVRDGTARPS
ncbi:MAG: hypothetical protein ACI81R_001881 [Bradymonadia bacterium]